MQTYYLEGLSEDKMIATSLRLKWLSDSRRLVVVLRSTDTERVLLNRNGGQQTRTGILTSESGANVYVVGTRGRVTHLRPRSLGNSTRCRW